MRKLILSLIVLFSTAVMCFAQPESDTLRNAGYLFSEFKSGVVLFKTGKTENALLNYNANNQSIAFMQGKDMMALTNVDDIDTVLIDEQYFVPVRNKFFEVVPLGGSYLYVAYNTKPHPLSASVDHGGTTLQDKDQVSGNVSDAYMNRRYKGNFFMEFQKDYLLKIKSGMYKINNEKQVRKVFPEKSDAIHSFISDNKISFDKPSDVIKVVQFVTGK